MQLKCLGRDVGQFRVLVHWRGIKQEGTGRTYRFKNVKITNLAKRQYLVSLMVSGNGSKKRG